MNLFCYEKLFKLFSTTFIKITMKGISPMIAVVLLLAFTVAVGGILSVWFTGFTRTTAAGVENATTDVTKCAGTYIDITSVSSTGIIITNRGSQSIDSIQCFASNGTEMTSVLGSTTLNPGASTAGGWVRGTNTRLDCSGRCLTIGVTGSCKSGESCWS